MLRFWNLMLHLGLAPLCQETLGKVWSINLSLRMGSSLLPELFVIGRDQNSLQIELRCSLVQCVEMSLVPLTTSSSIATFTSPTSVFSSSWTGGKHSRRPVTCIGGLRESLCLVGISTMMPSQGEPRITGVIGGGEETGEGLSLGLCSAKCQVPETRNLKLFKKTFSLFTDFW